MLMKPDEEFVKQGAAKVTTQDIEKVVAREDEIRKQFGARGPLKRFIEDGKMLMAMLKDYRVGNYRQLLRWTITAAAFALIYVFNPFDLVPDVLPVLGAVDDASVIAVCLMLIEQDLFKYRDWKIKQAGSIEDVTRSSGVQSEQ